VGRFVKIGIPCPQVMAPFVGVAEIVCGTLLLVGFLTSLAAVPLLIDIFVALYSTKIVTFAKNRTLVRLWRHNWLSAPVCDGTHR
jgi:putative oxidoreductase